MHRIGHRTRVLTPAICLGLCRFALAQEPLACAPGDDISIRSVSIVGTVTGSAGLVPVDTLWVPSEGRFDDTIFVRISPQASTAPAGDSIFVAATMELMLRGARGLTKGAPTLVAFPIRTLRDTIVSLTTANPVTLGPFSTNDLIPWPGISVEATPNSLPVEVTAVAWILRVHRGAGQACLEPLRNNVGRSRPIRFQFAK